jgi:glycosyltransferase involved in cell wall biosynthesis
VAYIGRLVQTQKRVLDLAPLVSELARRDVPFVMHVVGSGGDAPRLRVEFARARVAHHVRWWGWLTPAEVQVRLSQLDALVLPSDSEGLPFVLLEAMADGVVPIATRIPSGNTELVRDGENGLLVPVGDTQALADHLERLYRDPAFLNRLRRAAWVTSADYSVERMASAYETCLAGARERAPHPSGAFPVMPSCRSNYPFWLRWVKWRLSGVQAEVLRPPRYRARRQQ